MKKVRLGIIGMGNMGTGHLDHTLTGRTPEIEVTAVADTNPARLEATRALLNKRRADYPDLQQPDIALFGTAEEMLNSGLIDAVEIAVPHYDHPRYAIEAMRAGIHVMCEKPAGVYTLQVREMMEEADRHPDIVFGMMFNQRTNHVYRKMKEIMDSGALGPIRLLPTGTGTRRTMIRARGVPRGRVRAAAFCSISARITWICGSGFAVCRALSMSGCTLANGTTSRWRTT